MNFEASMMNQDHWRG